MQPEEMEARIAMLEATCAQLNNLFGQTLADATGALIGCVERQHAVNAAAAVAGVNNDAAAAHERLLAARRARYARNAPRMRAARRARAAAARGQGQVIEIHLP